MRHNKLVRDKIPQICQNRGQMPITRTLSEDEFVTELKKKLQEEVSEFLEHSNPAELVDILEVIYALATVHGVTKEQLEDMRLQKAEARGGFEDRVYLFEVKRS